MSIEILSVDALIPLYVTTGDFAGMLYIDYMKGQVYHQDLHEVDDDFNEAILEFLRNKQFKNYHPVEIPREELEANLAKLKTPPPS